MFPIRLPPLREREADIPALAAYFALRAAKVLNINPHTLRARMRKLGIDWGRFRSRAR